MRKQMKSMICFVTAALAFAFCLRVAQASGPVSVYARIDSVTFEPSPDKPERIRLSGVFIVATDQQGAYSAPQTGYLYLTLPKSNTDLALREWSDLKSIAGTRQVVGLGSIW